MALGAENLTRPNVRYRDLFGLAVPEERHKPKKTPAWQSVTSDGLILAGHKSEACPGPMMKRSAGHMASA
jgi:hypothetical protein